MAVSTSAGLSGPRSSRLNRPSAPRVWPRATRGTTVPDPTPSRASASRTPASGSTRSTRAQSTVVTVIGRPVEVTTRAAASSVITLTIDRT